MNVYPYSRTTTSAVSASAASLRLSGKAKTLKISSTKNCFISLDKIATATNGFYLEAGTDYELPILYPTTISAIRSTEDGLLTVMELGDKIIMLTTAGSITVNSNLLRTLDIPFEGVDPFYSNSSLKIIISDTLSGDSNLEKTLSATPLGDSNLEKIIEDELTSDSLLQSE